MITRFGASQLLLPRSLNAMLAAGLLAAGTLTSGQSAPTPAPAANAAAPSGSPSHYSHNRPPSREAAYYSILYGVDSFNVKAVESGELIRFTYRVLDGDKAKVLNDKKNEAYLVSPEKHVRLIVPSLEKVGQLRQSSTAIAGNTYWMAFSNPGRPVKPGDRVDIEIGQFHVQGLLVQ
jgi:hypothetical protein